MAAPVSSGLVGEEVVGPPASEKSPPASPPESTADSWNRIRDRERIEAEVGLAEGGGEATLISREDRTELARGYTRVVYGDHGPYVELTEKQVNWPVFVQIVRKGSEAYFDEGYPAAGAPMLYMQRRTVADRPNPPAGRWSTNRNRPEGYADYRAGFYYFQADEVARRENAEAPKAAESAEQPRKKRWGKKSSA